MKYITVGAGALNQTPLAWESNYQNLIQIIELAIQENIDILCLPELCICGYGCEDAFFSNSTMEMSLSLLHELLHHNFPLFYCVGLPLIYEGCIYNVSALIYKDSILGFVAKQDLAGDGIHYEPRWFKPWPRGQQGTVRLPSLPPTPIGDLIFEIDGVRIGFEICEDAWTGDRPAYYHYLHNVDLILNPSASHFSLQKSLTRQRLVTEASRSFSCTYVYANLLGNEAGRIIYDGELLIAQNGKLLARNTPLSYKDTDLIAVTLDVTASQQEKRKKFSFTGTHPNNLISFEPYSFPEKKPISITPIPPKTDPPETEFFKAVTLGLFDYMRKSYSKGFVISLSGGADSSACTILALYSLKRAIEEIPPPLLHQKLAYWKPHNLLKDGVTCVYQSTRNSSESTRQAAKSLTEELQIPCYFWNVDPFFDSYVKLVSECIGRPLNWETDDTPLQNIQARIRVPGIWLLANLKGSILLTTSNRSEAAVGYATMDGDTAGGLAPLAGISKIFLLHWLEWAITNLHISSLKLVLSNKPTAELRPPSSHQTDENDLMPYDILNQIEYLAIHQHLSPLETYFRLEPIIKDPNLPQYIHRFYTFWARNQWKRERYAPSFHLDDANLDPKTWCRFPILNGQFQKELKQLENFLRKTKS